MEDKLHTDEYLDLSPDEPEGHQLAPKVPKMDDPRINIPKSRAMESHDHVIVPKEIVPTAEHHEQYGQAYEASHYD